jgi:tRNA C32,U32 (ribose-2'-O)-methylase TrmJ
MVSKHPKQMDVGTMYKDTKGDTSIALLFGNESDGLTSDELRRVTDIVEIPTAATQGSINLSHAVAVTLGRLFDDCVRMGDWEDSLGGNDAKLAIRWPMHDRLHVQIDYASEYFACCSFAIG